MPIGNGPFHFEFPYLSGDFKGFFIKDDMGMIFLASNVSSKELADFIVHLLNGMSQSKKFSESDFEETLNLCRTVIGV